MARIEYTDPEGKVQRVDIPASETGAVIGRSPACQIVLPSHSVGRNHARISCRNGVYSFSDLGSVNGTSVNGARVTGTVELSDGAALRCGDITMRFFLENPPDAAVVHKTLEPPARRSPGSATAAPAPVVAPVAATSGADPIALAEAARLRKENAALRAELQAASGRGAAEPGDAGTIRRQLDDAKTSLAGAEEEIRHLRGVVADDEQRVKAAESRATMASSSLESIHAKYMDMRDQVQHVQGLLETARSEASDREIEATELREKAAAVQAQLDAIRGRTGQAAEEVSNLKVRLTERDREIERLKRELDVREYDLKALREENDRLQEYCQADTGRQNQLERKSRNLEAVIEDNRNLVAELRRSLEEKDREVREVRLGTGIADLEQEKQRLLDDYHKKSRELDGLRATVAQLQADAKGAAAERDELQARVRQLEESARTRRSEREDVSDHPEYRARVREIESRDETLRALQRELDGLRHEQHQCPPEERARLAADLAVTQEKARLLQARVDELSATLARRSAEAAASAGAPDALREFLTSLGEAVESLADGMVVLGSGLREMQGFLGSLAASGATLPETVVASLGGATLAETVDSLRDMERLLAGEMESLRRRKIEGDRLLTDRG